MQNTISNYINNKVINIKSEILFREAEDEFFYFNNINKAALKLKKAIRYTPSHVKSIVLYADICFIKGNFDEALSLYLSANILKKNDCKIIASIANCYNSLRKYEEALKYSNEALNLIKDEDCSLCAQVIELKINNLVYLGKYDEAHKIFVRFCDILKQNLVHYVYNSLNKKIKLHQKIYYSGLKIV